MTNKHLFPLTGIVLALTIMSFGCQPSNKPSDLPKLHKVTVHLTQEGVPVEGAMVNLLPKSPSKWSSGGRTDIDGNCIVRTHRQFIGVPEGSYDLTISKIAQQETGRMIPGSLPGKEVAEMATLSTIDSKYQMPGELSIEVTSSGKNFFEFDLGPAIQESIKSSAPGKK